MPQPRQCVLYLADSRTQVVNLECNAVRSQLQSALQGWMDQGARQSNAWPMLSFPTDKDECYINALQVVQVEAR